MKQGDKELEQQLDAALGKPKYYIDTPDKKEGERYFWFPTSGDSMTDNTQRSIPGGSLVLGRLLSLKSVQDIPLHRPIVVVINDNGQQFTMTKSACALVADGEEKFCLRSYNQRYDDFWLPFSCVKFIFVIERVRRPNGSEFIPVQGEVIRKGREA